MYSIQTNTRADTSAVSVTIWSGGMVRTQTVAPRRSAAAPPASAIWNHGFGSDRDTWRRHETSGLPGCR
jgi:hypothetical protein